jgi:hypothetical protein
LTENEGDLVERATAQAKAKRVDRKAKRRVKREEKRAAERWWKLEDSLEKAQPHLEDWAADYEPPRAKIRVGSDRQLDPAGLFIPIHDLHYGKYAVEAECGADYNREIAEDRAKTAVESVLRTAVRQSSIEQIYAICGTSDWHHIDRDSPPSTTAGTPQDTDGTIGEILAGAQSLAVELIDEMRSVAPTDMVYCEGNHDRVTGLATHRFLRGWYREAEDVTFTKNRRPRQYFSYGPTSVCAHHGEIKKSQLKQLGNVIAREHHWNEYVMAVSGHKHFRKADDHGGGLMMHQCLSLSGSDRWHERNLYTGLPGLQAFVLDKEEGPTATPTWYV